MNRAKVSKSKAYAWNKWLIKGLEKKTALKIVDCVLKVLFVGFIWKYLIGVCLSAHGWPCEKTEIHVVLLLLLLLFWMRFDRSWERRRRWRWESRTKKRRNIGSNFSVELCTHLSMPWKIGFYLQIWKSQQQILSNEKERENATKNSHHNNNHNECPLNFDSIYKMCTRIDEIERA